MRMYSLTTFTAGIGFAVFAALFPSTAGACGTSDLVKARPVSPFEVRPFLKAEANATQPTTFGSQDAIVGMWKVTFTATDGSGFMDFGYQQWHSDGTEFFNSGGRAPSTQNFCLGVWQKTGSSAYFLNHFALAYDTASGDLVNKINIRLVVSANSDSQTFSGKFEILIYDPTGTVLDGTIQGNVTGSRVTIATTTP